MSDTALPDTSKELTSEVTPETHWPCACVKRERNGKMKAIKLHPLAVKYCRECGMDQRGYQLQTTSESVIKGS